jgi:hypothetical protein
MQLVIHCPLVKLFYNTFQRILRNNLGNISQNNSDLNRHLRNLQLKGFIELVTAEKIILQKQKQD